MELTRGFVELLEEFRTVFNSQSFLLFVDLMTGWTLSHRHRYVTDLILSAGAVGKGHFSNYHRFFSRYVWRLDGVCRVLTLLLVRLFARSGVIELAVDDTLCRKRGLTVYGTGMHHDPLISSKAKKLCSWGHDWVVVCLLVRCPRWAPTKVFSLPICFRLYRNRQGLTKGKKKRKRQQKVRRDPNHRTRPELAVEMLGIIASWLPDREILVSGDSAYGGASVLQKLPENMDLISHVHPKGALYKPAPKPQKGEKGCGAPRKKGDRLPGMAAWAEDRRQPWKTMAFTVEVKTIKALYYKAGKDRLLVIVLVRDVLGKRPDQMFYCTRLNWGARKILGTYAGRWSIEVTFENSKQLLGFEDPANRKEKAVRRTAPMALVLYSLNVAWFDREGHRYLQFPDRPWYRKKQEPSFADMLTTLRRRSWEDKCRHLLPKRGPLKKHVTELIHFLSLAG
ncbi:MAG: IS701 family transposase [Planctomycetota bacterium]|jgi:hypothetical protein